MYLYVYIYIYILGNTACYMLFGMCVCGTYMFLIRTCVYITYEYTCAYMTYEYKVYIIHNHKHMSIHTCICI